jgi:hypothetical protein
MPIVRLQQHTIMPFIIMQQLHMPPASMVHKFCTMLLAMASSQEQVIFIPPVHFSILNLHRGTMVQFGAPVIPAGPPIVGIPIPDTPIPCIPIPVRSIIMVDIP